MQDKRKQFDCQKTMKLSVKIEQILFDSQHKADIKEGQLCMQLDHFYLYELSFPNKYSKEKNKM